jgi:hypothetical protein
VVDAQATSGDGYEIAAWFASWVQREFGEGPHPTANPWVQIETLDPGWGITISLTGTSLQEAGLQQVSAGDLEIERSETDWIHVWVDGGLRDNYLEWQGRGGSSNLVELLRLFRDWADAHTVAP